MEQRSCSTVMFMVQTLAMRKYSWFTVHTHTHRRMHIHTNRLAAILRRFRKSICCRVKSRNMVLLYSAFAYSMLLYSVCEWASFICKPCLCSTQATMKFKYRRRIQSSNCKWIIHNRNGVFFIVRVYSYFTVAFSLHIHCLVYPIDCMGDGGKKRIFIDFLIEINLLAP